MRTLWSTLALGGLVVASGCSLAGDDTIDLSVASLRAPDRARAGEAFRIELVAQTPNSCASFKRVEADETPGRLTLRAVGRYRDDANVSCGQSIEDIETAYDHAPATPGALVITAEGYGGRVEARVVVE